MSSRLHSAMMISILGLRSTIRRCLIYTLNATRSVPSPQPLPSPLLALCATHVPAGSLVLIVFNQCTYRPTNLAMLRIDLCLQSPGGLFEQLHHIRIRDGDIGDSAHRAGDAVLLLLRLLLLLWRCRHS